MKLDIPREENYGRLRLWMVSRMIFVTFLLASLVFFQYRYQVYQIDLRHFIYFTACVYVVSFSFWSLLKRTRNLSLLAYLLIGSDIVFISWLVTLTGVIDSGFSILYHIAIISASIILYRKGGYFSAALISILYGVMLDFQYYNMLGYVRSQNYSAGQVLYLLFVSILSFYVVAFLSGHLSERLRKTREQLHEKNIDFNDLRVLQENIVRSVGSGIVSMDMNGLVTSWNNSAEAITGYGFAEIRDQWRTVFSDSIKVLFDHANDLREKPVRFEGRIRKKDGSFAELGLTASLLKDNVDVVRGIIVTFQDITRMVQMEEEMRRQERLATIGSLAAGIAHEIRNPLASLSGSIQILKEDLHLEGESRQLMDIVLRETDRLNTIITEFLDYAKPKTIQNDIVCLSELAQETAGLFQNSLGSRHEIHLMAEIEPSLSVRGDGQRLRQVFWNLLINSGQAITGAGTISMKVHGTTSSGVDQVLIRIADTGIGIPTKLLGKIFDPFFTTKTDGTGLGLAIVHRIVEDHGGSIDVKSEEGSGTAFTIFLPVQERARSVSMRV